jgi:hypothetical protein
MRTPQQVLAAAALLIQEPAAWTRRAMARTADDDDVSVHHPEACKWCAIGAIERVCTNCFEALEVCQYLYEKNIRNTGYRCISQWNDAVGRTHADVLEAFKEASK